MKQVTIQPILELIDKLYAIHEELLELAKEKTPVLVGNDINQLNRIIHKENKLIRQIADMEQLRVQVIGEYLISRGYNPDPRVTISDMVRIVFKAEEKKALTEGQKRLLDRLNELRKQNEINQKLLEQSLAFVNFSVELLAGDPDQDIIYKRPAGPMSVSARNGIFDTKA